MRREAGRTPIRWALAFADILVGNTRLCCAEARAASKNEVAPQSTKAKYAAKKNFRASTAYLLSEAVVAYASKLLPFTYSDEKRVCKKPKTGT
jgi:hypothetical protein